MKTDKTIKQFNIKQPKDIFGFCFNIFLILLEILGIIFLFTVPLIRWDGKSIVANWTTFKFFTTDSNLIALIASLIYVIFVLLIWTGKRKTIPLWVYVVKHTATISIALTMIVTVTILTPGAASIKQYPVSSLYMGSNLLFHLICPIVGILTFLLFETRQDIKYKHTFWPLILIVIYSIFYIVMAYTHQNPDGTFQPGYDWYKFCSFGKIPMPVIMIIIFGIYYLTSWLLWLGNKKIQIKSLQKEVN